MATYEPKTVYRRKVSVPDTELPNYTTKALVDVDAEIKKLDSLKKFRTAYDTAVAEIKAHAGSEAAATTLAELKELSEFIDFYGPIINQAKEAQKELTLKFLMDGKDLDEIKSSVGNSTPWLTIESWAGKFTGIGKDKKFVEWLVPDKVGEAVKAKVLEARNS